MAQSVRTISTVLASRPTLEGAGVHLKRAFGPGEVPLLDPFLMLDDFHSANPADYIAGFPWHPHRGIETVTYMISGVVRHGDSLGNKGIIESGEVQWMTAGSGILHEEMPQPWSGMMQGFQLWVNLPASQKMMRPRYRDIKSDQIPILRTKTGAEIKVISGEVNDMKGPASDLVVEAQYVDVTVPPNKDFRHHVKQGHKAFAYVFAGAGIFHPDSKNALGPEHAVVFGEGKDVKIKAGDSGLRFLLVTGPPLGEPIAWGGPIVMNTQAELDQSFRELRSGTFIKK